MKIIIRSIGERTEKCLFDQLQGEDVAIVSEKPLSNTLKKAFLLAVDSKSAWTLHIDADVLLIPGSLANIYKRLETQEKNVFAVQFLVADALLGDVRYAGNSAYRVDLIPEALGFIDESYDKFRPVRHVVKRMEEKGYRFIDQKEEIIGLHDAEQYYRDIYRKAFFYAFKHLNKTKEFIPYWRDKSERAFEIALLGFADGIKARDPKEMQPREFSDEREPLTSIDKQEIMRILGSTLSDHYAISEQKKVYRWIK